MRFHLLLGAGAVAVAIVSVLGATGAAASAATVTGYDISWPQCSTSLPRSATFGIVGVNDGIAWSQNPCLRSEYAWASSRPSAPALYMNTADPGPQSSHWALGGPRAASCNPAVSTPTSAAYIACAYDYGWNTAADALNHEASSLTGASSRTWWLDVETTNTWSNGTAANAQDVQGSIDYLHAAGVHTVGIYSTTYQWGVITAGYAFPSYTPEWGAGAGSLRQARNNCSARPFGGIHSTITLTQYAAGNFDGDVAC